MTVGSQAGIEQQVLEIDGAKTFFNRTGAGNAEVVLMLHGAGPGAAAFGNWQFALPALGDRYDCIAPDMAGYGQSEIPSSRPGNMRDWNRVRTQRTFALMDELGIEKAHVMGNSMGGRLALEMMSWQPERIGRAVLMGSGGAPMTFTPELRRLADFYDDPTPQRMGQLISWFTYNERFVGDELDAIARDRVEAASRPEVRIGHETTFVEPIDFEVPGSALRRMDHPTLLLHGANDVYVEVSCSEYLAEQMPNAHLHVIPRCGHWIQIEKAEAFNNLVGLFLAGGLD